MTSNAEVYGVYIGGPRAGMTGPWLYQIYKTEKAALAQAEVLCDNLTGADAWKADAWVEALTVL